MSATGTVAAVAAVSAFTAWAACMCAVLHMSAAANLAEVTSAATATS